MKRERTIAVLGAGNGGQAMAADLAAQGFRVHLWNRSPSRIQPILRRGGIQLKGLLNDFGSPHLVTTDLESALQGADVIMVVITANAHRSLAEKLAPHLQEGQIILLNPGRTGGALEVANVLQKKGLQKHVYIAEAQTLVYASRIIEPAVVKVLGIKKFVPVAALPAADTPHMLELVQDLYPSFKPAQHVLETSLGNIGAIFHPAVALFNASRIDKAISFRFYKSVTPSIASFLEKLDKERLDVGKAFGLDLESAFDWISHSYPGITEGEDLCNRIQSNPAYSTITAPSHLNTRLLFEDVPTGLIPLASLGRIADISTPLCSSTAIIASALTGKNYHREGRTLSRMGIQGMTGEEMLHFVMHGSQKRPSRKQENKLINASKTSRGVYPNRERRSAPFQGQGLMHQPGSAHRDKVLNDHDEVAKETSIVSDG
ncbi:MAG: NAD/NADP octopine/nopaline dehydrogenase family protein [Desulfobacteraceae bacterium]|jgi:opine dehydrogenase